MKQQLGIWMGLTAALLAAISSVLTFAPFTPAVVITALTVPAGVAAIALGTWRAGLFALYWSIVAILAVPNVIPPQLEVAFLAVYPFGLVFGVALFLHYRNFRG